MLPQLDPTWYASQSLWMLITFCAMFLVVWRLVMPAMRATVDTRRSQIETDIQKTEELKTEAARLLKEIEAQQASVKQQTQAIYAQAQQDAQDLTKQMETEFNERLTTHIALKEQALADAKQAALRDVAKMSAELASQIVQKLTGITLTTAEIEQTAGTERTK